MSDTPNPYRSPEAGSRASGSMGRRSVSNWLRFRYHVAATASLALIAAYATGTSLEAIVNGLDWLPMTVLAIEFGLWAHPLNLIFSLVVLVAIPALEIAKRVWPADGKALRMQQIFIWWAYWGLVSIAMACGTYRGP